MRIHMYSPYIYVVSHQTVTMLLLYPAPALYIWLVTARARATKAEMHAMKILRIHTHTRVFISYGYIRGMRPILNQCIKCEGFLVLFSGLVNAIWITILQRIVIGWCIMAALIITDKLNRVRTVKKKRNLKTKKINK